MDVMTRSKFRKYVRREAVGYFAPLIAVCRMIKKRRWNFIHEMRVIYRYVFGKRF